MSILDRFARYESFTPALVIGAAVLLAALFALPTAPTTTIGLAGVVVLVGFLFWVLTAERANDLNN